MFIAALFTATKTRKQAKCSLTDEWIQMWYIYAMEYHKKEWTNIYSNMDGPRDYHTKWTKLGRERQVPYDTLICRI